jgi:molybdopterin-guanine dinucleotide biosynthesis protein A
MGGISPAMAYKVQDRVHLVYIDTPFAVEEQFETLSRYANALGDATFEAAVAQS